MSHIFCWYFKPKAATYWTYGLTIWKQQQGRLEGLKLENLNSGFCSESALHQIIMANYAKFPATFSMTYDDPATVNFCHEFIRKWSLPYLSGDIHRNFYESDIYRLLPELKQVMQSSDRVTIPIALQVQPDLIFDEIHPLNILDLDSTDPTDDTLPISRSAYLALEAVLYDATHPVTVPWYQPLY